MYSISEGQLNVEWSKFCTKFSEVGLDKFYNMDELMAEMSVSPCTTNEESGVAYKGALIVHIMMLLGLSQRLAKMISGTFEIDDASLTKVCLLAHLSKRSMFEESTNDWDIKRGYPFKFKETGTVLKTGERSILEAMNKGVKLTPEEYEAIRAIDEDDPSKRPFQGIMATVLRQANDLAYSIEKERYKKIKNNNNA